MIESAEDRIRHQIRLIINVGVSTGKRVTDIKNDIKTHARFHQTKHDKGVWAAIIEEELEAKGWGKPQPTPPPPSLFDQLN